ncbi:MAG: hypothetical protein ACTHKM_08865 [Tsuneonella sp.]
MALNRASRFKGAGYLTSTISVILLAVVALKGAKDDGLLMACLILGAVTSVAGMGLRWRSHRIEQHEKAALKRQANRNSEAVN